MMKKLLQLLVSLLGIILFVLISWHLLSAQSLAKPQDIPSDFVGTILAASDADMIATAYANGILNKVNGIEDSLICIGIEAGQPLIKSQIHASNSVISWPAVLEWSPKHRYAFIAETRGIITGDNNKFDNVFYDFPKGERISIVDFQDLSNPVTIEEKAVGENLQNVSINAAGGLLAAGTTAKGKELMIASLKDGLIDQIFFFSDDVINYSDNRDGGFRTVEFHPTENVIAVNLNGTSVAFYRVNRNSTGIDIERLGSPIEAGKKLSVGNWHPSGQYFIVSDVGWGNGNLGFVTNGRGKLISVRFDQAGNHELVSKLKVGLSPEGFDLSPNGNYAVTVNMRRTYLPKNYWFIPARKKSSLSLIKIDETTGKLSRIGKAYGFRGALPEDAIFDAASNSLAVAVYHELDAEFPSQGWIDFWEIKEDKLIKTNRQLKVARGVHNLLLVP